MARVVQRNTGSPHLPLLIVMIVLFLVSTGFAVYFYVQVDGMEEDYRRMSGELQILVSETDRQSPDYIRLSRQASPPTRTVVSQFRAHVSELSSYISPGASDFDTALAQIRDLEGQLAGRGIDGLVEQIALLQDEIAQRRAEVTQIRGQIETVNQTLSTRNEEIAQVRRELERVTQAHRAEVAQLGTEARNREAAHRRQLERAEQEFAQSRQLLRNETSEAIAQNDELRLDLHNREIEIQRLRDIVRQARVDRTPGADPASPDGPAVVASPAMSPDGRIVRAIDGTDVVYINLGSSDRVRPGLSFAVYPEGGIPASGMGKAQIVVTRVGASTSEARIVEQRPDDPVMPNDLIANLAFSPTQTHKFVVLGRFDLYGTGRPTDRGTEEIKALIHRFGGEVHDEISVQTDFLVLGEAPMMPPRPDATATQAQFDLWERAQAEARRYQQVSEVAHSFGIPVLNTSRFLAFTGYQPQKTDRFATRP